MKDAIRALRVTLAIGFRAAPWHATFQWITGMLFAVGAPISAYGAKLLVDAAVTQDLRSGLVAAALLAVVAGGVLIAVFYYCDCVFTVIERSGALASRRLMELMAGTDGLAHHEHPKYLDEVQLIREERNRLASMVNATAGILRVTATLVATTILLASLHPILLVLPVFAVLSFWLGKRSRDVAVAAQEATSESERLRRHLFEIGTAAPSGKELRVFGLTDVLLRRHHETSDAVLYGRNRATWQAAGLQSLDGLASAFAYIGAISLVLVLALRGEATPGDVVLAIGLVASVSGMVSTAVSYGTEFLHVLTQARRFVWLEDYARAARCTPDDPRPVPERLTDGIVLENVGFRYPDTESSVLQGVSLRLPAGKVIALVGENGAGKTTLIKLLADFYQPDSGRILVDGVDLADFPPEKWRSRLGAVFQDYAAFEILARESVGIADLPRIDDTDAVGAALERAGATNVMTALPNGMNTQLGKAWEGVELSGGQWQKLALGRGLMRTDPLLVVFDEPTAALDPQTEHDLFERFAAAARAGHDRGTVTLLVSHRFSTVRMADLIVVLDGGMVLEYGSHDELMTADGLYAELYELQSQAYR